MTQLETDILKLKTTLVEMWDLVINQFEKTRDVLENCDSDLAQEVLANEKRVDAYELKIDMDCENLLALQNPVANDLRFVLAVLKINYNLERIGDYSNGIAKLINGMGKPVSKDDLDETHILGMFDTAKEMLNEALDAFETENVHLARNIFKLDSGLDKVNKHANAIIGNMISGRPKDTNEFLNLLSIIRKLERVGDQTKNIAEEIIFYIEAKVLRHKKKKEKLAE